MVHISISILLFNLLNNFLNPYILTMGSKSFIKNNTIIKETQFPILISVFIAGIASIFVLNIEKYYRFNLDINPGIIFIYYIAFLLIDVLKKITQISGNFNIYSLILVSDKLIFFLLIIFLYLLNIEFTVYNFLNTLIISTIFSFIIFFYILKENITFKFTGNFNPLNCFKYSKLTFLISSISVVYSYQLIIILFSSYFDTITSGYVSLGFSLIGFLIVPFFWIEPILAKKFSEKISFNNTKFLKIFINKLIISIIYLYTLLILIVINLVINFEIIEIIFGESFKESLLIITLLLPISILEGLNILLIWIFYNKNRQKVIIFCAIIRTISLVFSFVYFTNINYILTLYFLFALISIVIFFVNLREYISKKGIINLIIILFYVVILHFQNYLYFKTINIIFFFLFLTCLYFNKKYIKGAYKVLKNEF